MEKEKEQEEKLVKKKKAIMHAHDHNNTVMRMASIAISLNARLKASDMPLHMQEHALHYTRSLITHGHGHHHYPSNKLTHTHLARELKKEFDSMYGPAWHCVIGTSFGSYVSHTGGAFFYFSIDSLSVLLFKTEVYLLTPPPPPPHTN
ncbi:dynein light chain 1, cytoplasmic-like [Arachis stenosperma]|uniref:dynein light chain 1, cytoplasmic-like n=1 Tax=Arachis stenosperma TaxID=217475 RepID=UPI0025AC0834|nr:dynein light chain 1, cytoplasmic-like [Arachis stenosperma]